MLVGCREWGWVSGEQQCVQGSGTPSGAGEAEGVPEAPCRAGHLESALPSCITLLSVAGTGPCSFLSFPFGSLSEGKGDKYCVSKNFFTIFLIPACHH